MQALGRPAPIALFFGFLALHLLRRFAEATLLAQSVVDAEERRLSAALFGRASTLGPDRPAVQSDSIQSLLALTERLLAYRSYRGARWESDWADQGLGLCAELEELERLGRLDAHQIEVSHRFIDQYLNLRPGPARESHV